MVGTVVVWISFLAAVVSAYSYYRTATKKKHSVRIARQSFSLMVAGSVAASALMMMYVLRHQFEYSYVWSYSSRDLPLHLLITTFWAGQEGSFLFWSFCSAFTGFFLLRYTQRQQTEYETMAVYALLQSFLLLLLITKSPFTPIWDAFPGQVASGQIPLDGRGLNPLLQNFWMIIHPPVLFIGFAAMAVPFSLAVAALWRKAYSEWILGAYPWVLFAVIALGAGLMLGGYWAYGVLGWGGWWGWDPVENSSLVPWIIAAALLHTMTVQRKNGKLLRTNFILAIAGLLLVIYSTFLTRSGILGESSVHSFVDPGSLVYTLLIVWMVAVTGLGIGVLAKRWTELRALSQPVGMFTRESFLAVAAAAMSASALVILFGTSWPLLSQSTVEPRFYDSMNLPIAIIIALLIGASLLLQWRLESLSGFFRRAAFSLAGAAIATALMLLAGVTDVQMIIFGFASWFAFLVSLRHGYRVARDNPRLLGGATAHIGLAVLFLAIVGSGRYGEKTTTTLELNKPREVLGYSLTYTGAQLTGDGKQKFIVQGQKEGSSFSLEPVMFFSSYSSGIMRNPDYISFLSGDFYIEPVSLEKDTAAANTGSIVQLVKGEPTKLADATVTFLRFDMNQRGAQDMMGGGGFAVGAVLEVRRGSKKEQITVVSAFKPNETAVGEVTMLKDGRLGFQLISMNVDMESKKSIVEISISGMAGPARTSLQTTERLVIEASAKPVMSFVWVGAFLVLAGAFLALLQARRQAGPIRFKNGRRNGRERNNQEQKPAPSVVVEEIGT